MLTDDLRDVLHERAADVDGDALSVLARLEAQVSRRRRGWHRPARFAVAGVVATIVAVVVLALGRTGSEPTKVTVGGASEVPCATPTRTPNNYIDWPCASGPVDAYFRELFDHPRQYAADVATLDENARVLAFGDIPASRPGGRFVVAETWDPGTLQTKLMTLFTQPAGVLPQSTQEHLAQYGVEPDDPTASSGGFDPTPPPIGALIIVSTPHPSAHFLTSCGAQLAHIPGPRHGYLAACSNIVVTRNDVTEIRLIHNGVVSGEPVPVSNRFTGLPSPRVNRPGWTIEARNANGEVVGSVPWRAMI